MFGGSRKDQIFYGALQEQSQLAVDAAGRFREMLGDVRRAEQLASAIRDDEKRADAVFRETVRALHGTWITPIDRHHIHELVTRLDGVLGLIAATATRVVLFRLREDRPDASELARHLCEACSRVHAATELVPKLSKDNAEALMRLSSEIHEIEGRADEVHQRALAALFDGRSEALEVVKWLVVLDNLEQATNLCRDVAGLFEAVVLASA